MNEIWKDVKGYEGLYQVSNLGRVKSLDRIDRKGRLRKGRILKPSSNGRGYLNVCLTVDNIPHTIKVHRLVAEAFISNPDNLPQVNHKDEIKTNNHADNLEWCTAEYNSNYGSRNVRMGVSHTKITEDDILKVERLSKEGLSTRKIAAELNIGKTTAWRITSGKYQRWMS